MIKRLLLTGALALIASAPALAEQGVTTSQSQAQAAVTRLQSMVGQQAPGDLQVTSVAADKDTLVVTVDGKSGWNGMAPDQIRDSFMSGFCKDPARAKTFFATSWVRVDTLDHGANLRHGAPTNVCPVAP